MENKEAQSTKELREAVAEAEKLLEQGVDVLGVRDYGTLQAMVMMGNAILKEDNKDAD
jgi:hypothetical protein